MTARPDAAGTDGLDPAVLAVADRLADAWRGRAAAAERARVLPAETLEELRRHGLLRIVAPSALGGLGSDWPTLAEVARRAARSCASTAWIIGVVGGHAALAGRLAPEAVALLFSSGEPPLFATASVPVSNGITTTADGVLVRGHWRFSSGVDQADWVIINAAVPSDRDGAGERLLIPVRRDKLTVKDDWHVSGMAGTGSRSVLVDDVFVPRAMLTGLDQCLAGGVREGPAGRHYLLEVPLHPYLTTTVAGPVLGCAEGALSTVVSALSARRGVLGGDAGRAFVADRLTESSAEIACAQHVFAALRATLHRAGLERRSLHAGELSTVHRDRAFLTRLCVRAVHRLVELLGTEGHFEDSALSRHWRDLQFMAAHRDVSWAGAADLYTRTLLSDVPSPDGISHG